MNEPRRPTTRSFSPYGYQIDQEREERVWGVLFPVLWVLAALFVPYVFACIVGMLFGGHL
jgi:hypothetical protein